MSTSKQRTVCVAMMAAVGLLGFAMSGCSKSSRSKNAKRAAETSGELVYTDAVTATVEEVDQKNRTVTLREPEGERFVVAVGEGVALERVEPDDRVSVAYQESLAFELQQPGHAPLPASESSTTDRLPEGVQFGRKVTTTVEILAVAPQGAAATFRNPEGAVRTVEVDNPINRQKVANLRPGDNVEVTYTEKLAVQLEK